jgi:SAM-dependent methyltransferase
MIGFRRGVAGVKSVAKRVLRRGGGADYRAALFDDLRAYSNGVKLRRILEIGPKDGQDTRRLLGLEPEELVVIDLPRMKDASEQWLRELDRSRLRYISANFMYSDLVEEWDPFDCIWCTGVLYHNPEQLRMLKRLFDRLHRGGILVIESATIRRPWLRHANCVEIIYPPSEKIERKYHLSRNITHVPSAKALASWLAMVGFHRIVRSECHRKSSAALARHRAAYLATKPLEPRDGTYYSLDGDEGFVIGRAR